MQLKQITGGLIAAACLVAGSAQANTITFDLSNVATQKTNLTEMLMTFQQFDASWGILTGVELDVYSDVSTTVKLTNNNTSAKTPVVTLPVNLVLGMPVGSALTGSQNLLQGTLAVAAKVGTVAGVATKTDNLVVAASQSYSGADLATFTGTGTLNSYLTVTANSQFSANKIQAQYNTMANGYGHVTYTFTALPVPEPETYGMLLAGLALVGFAAKRSKRAA
jgi:hypothetical protein